MVGLAAVLHSAGYIEGVVAVLWRAVAVEPEVRRSGDCTRPTHSSFPPAPPYPPTRRTHCPTRSWRQRCGHRTGEWRPVVPFVTPYGARCEHLQRTHTQAPREG